MLIFANLDIKRKLTALSMVVSGSAVVIACLAFVLYEQGTFRDKLVAEMSPLANITARNIQYTLYVGGEEDQKSTEEFLDTLRAQRQIVAACAYREGRVWPKYPTNLTADAYPSLSTVATNVDTDLFVEAHLLLFRPVFYSPTNQVGMLFIKASLGEMYARQRRYALIALGVLIVSGIVAFLLASWLRRPITEPILDLTEPITGSSQTSARVAGSQPAGSRSKLESKLEGSTSVSNEPVPSALPWRIPLPPRSSGPDSRSERPSRDHRRPMMATIGAGGSLTRVPRSVSIQERRPVDDHTRRGLHGQLVDRDHEKPRSVRGDLQPRGERFSPDLPVRCHLHAGWLQVPMDDALLVGLLEGLGDLPGDANGLAGRDGAARSGSPPVGGSL